MNGLQSLLLKKMNLGSAKALTTSLTTSLVLFVSMLYLIPAIAQSNNDVQIKFNETEPDASSQGRPSGRKGTGSRGDCVSVEIPLNAIAPNYKPGLAVEENPTLWFYVPYQVSQVSTGEFSLQDESKADVVRSSFIIPSQPGIVSLKLKTAKLDINKTYQWYFKLYCRTQSASKSSTPVFVSGAVRRVAPSQNLVTQLKAATSPRARIAAYATQGIWYTTLTELASLRATEPKNTTLVQDWQNLLNDVGLNYLADKPIVGEIDI